MSQRRDQIAVVAYEHFDFATISSLVINPHWRMFRDDERARFVDSFKDYLARSYGRRLDEYDDANSEVVESVETPRHDYVVRTLVRGGKFNGREIDYRMRCQSGQEGVRDARCENGRWLVIDVLFNGVSMVKNFRAQFRPILNKGGAQELLRVLGEKNLEDVVSEFEAEISNSTAGE